MRGGGTRSGGEIHGTNHRHRRQRGNPPPAAVQGTDVLLDERVSSIHLCDGHAAEQLIERLAWAVGDAEDAERTARRAALADAQDPGTTPAAVPPEPPAVLGLRTEGPAPRPGRPAGPAVQGRPHRAHRHLDPPAGLLGPDVRLIWRSRSCRRPRSWSLQNSIARSGPSSRARSSIASSEPAHSPRPRIVRVTKTPPMPDDRRTAPRRPTAILMIPAPAVATRPPAVEQGEVSFLLAPQGFGWPPPQAPGSPRRSSRHSAVPPRRAPPVPRVTLAASVDRA